MSSNKKNLIMNTVSVSLGCSSCRKSKLTSFFNPKPKQKLKPKPKSHSLHNYHSSSSSTKKTTTHCSLSEYETGTSFSPSTDTTMYWDMDMDTDQDSTNCSMATVRGFGHLGGESLAVEKDSDDPYLDFTQSMLQMILEKEIYTKDDLKDLLNCFLQLNSPYHHGIIVRAFTEIWNGVFSVEPGAGSGATASSKLLFGFRPGYF
ncbi:Transcription repressor OFP8 [Hibiscus syriacus]|uniref:Transcription repressor n=1 Tax=Hibiscus syriacus TaxID=106335 RepID=A0A6A3CQC1_HIBSY|nr:transcription repressor OFP6-like [Hibiscus syriacus]KAE8731126.1 Transcription repressor OFP8 [Hibiscus syriacus]